MEEVLKRIELYTTEINSARLQDAEALEAFRIKYLGTKGIVKELMAEMKQVPAEKKKAFGQLLNEFKELAENTFQTHQQTILAAGVQEYSSLDVSLPGDTIPLGSRHPVSLMRNQIISIFQRLGFSVVEGPEIEDDFHNFTALNLPAHHPARDMQDTFYLHQNPDWLLRTHTSNIFKKFKLLLKAVAKLQWKLLKLGLPQN